MAGPILSNKALRTRLERDLMEACNILMTIKELTPMDEANAYTHAVEMLCSQAGWLVDRSIVALGNPGVFSAKFEDWSGVK